ncbi:lamin tail domain-containing protein [Pseudolysinimonas sp.]|uniref:lamin tail domain-containing protein n=1 Tax=Pseudolysinimonas sp. TaxID=2680009 RepID=UPI003784EE29
MLRPLLATLSTLLLIGGGLAVAGPAAAELPKPAYDATPSVLLNEVAGGGPRSDADGFFELRNWGDEPVDLTGWEVYRCSFKALRAKVGTTEGDLRGVVLQPGEILTVSRIGLPGDLHFSAAYDLTGYGLYLEAPDDSAVDMVGVYPNEPWPTRGECTPPGGNLPNVLDFAQNESWQRIAATGDPARDWIVAPATLGERNALRAPAASVADVVISELAGAGPGGSDDDFVELRNAGAETVDLGGWELYRCSASGRVRPDTLQVTIPAGTRLKPGETWVAGAEGFGEAADARYTRPLADREFGVLVRDADGALVDRVAVTAYGDSACQGDAKLPAVLDMARAESYQLTAAGTYLIAPRTPGRRNAVRADALVGPAFAGADPTGVAISELATDPTPEGMPAGSVQRNYLELGNYGDESVDIGGWTAWRCMVDGARATQPQVTIPRGTLLEPGEVYLVARAGTAAAEGADATFDTSFSLNGTGVWLADADGERVDSVGVYATNEIDGVNVTFSPCTTGAALTTYQPDRLLKETFQRTQFSGVDADDFVVAEATPGRIDEIPSADPTERVDIRPDVEAAPQTPATAPEEPRGATVGILEAWGGATQGGALTSLAGEDELRLDPSALGALADDGYGYPYQRLVLDAATLKAGSTVSWAGRGLGRTEVQLSVWSGDAWRLLDAGTGDDLVLSGQLEAGDIRGDRVTLLAQNGPRTQPTLAAGVDGELQDPDAYDFAISHITDTQYLSESYPEVYATLASWIAANAEGRKIEFATHTGDLIQNYVNPAQDDVRAVREFERASAIQGILDDAGVPNSVLPGNHDNLRGADATLFNTYFGPDRYAGTAWYGGSLAPDDNSANFSTFEHAGARFLMLSLPYAFGDAELTWAEGVVAAHPDHNVIVSTHEHVTPKTRESAAYRSSSSRWVSRGQELWERVIAPNRNVVLVLSGHFHGLGQIRTEDAGGLPGHTVTELVADYQEFRTHTGERATGFQRLLQIDLAAGTIAVDTFSLRLDETSAFEYDYRQAMADNGSALTPTNSRPWRIVESGLQGRYGVDDDEFAAAAHFQYPKSVATVQVVAEAPTPAPLAYAPRSPRLVELL